METSQQTSVPANPRNPVADAAAIVLTAHARFTVLRPALIRIEWSPHGVFEDRASLTFINRALPVPAFNVERENGWLIIATERITLRYDAEAPGPFSDETLSIDVRVGEGNVTWKPSAANPGNLGGTLRTLDGVDGPPPPPPPGLLSRDGWVVIDDSQRPLLDPATGPDDQPWAAARPFLADGQLDWYFFGQGHEYISALQDFTHVAGAIPLPPRFIFGAWWSRYWAYTDLELKQLVADFAEHDVPLDVLVIDMDWHLEGWTGYTWNPRCFPDPDGFLRWAHQQGLHVTLNLHPADGVGKHEARFGTMCSALGLDHGSTYRIPFEPANPKFMDAYFKILHHPLQRMGVDFWWIDWQQGHDTTLAGLDPLFWLNHLHFTDLETAGRQEDQSPRPLIFSRYGGLGNHRYPIGFSGDTYSNWPTLAGQPHFTSTAGNVGFGYWSHDIGGHFHGPLDPELYVRWIQFGALSPVLRTHTSKSAEAERRIWRMPHEYFLAAREAFQLRYELLPYIYTMARRTTDAALPLCRPMYYHWPELSEAYAWPGQYMFGDDLLVAPVAEPMNPETQRADIGLWLPPGDWVSWFSGELIHGGREIQLAVPLSEIPLLARSGAVIPTTAIAHRTQRGSFDPLILNIMSGRSGRARIYDDDGVSTGYQRGEFAFTPIVHEEAGSTRRIVIGPSEGTFAGMSESRAIVLRVFGSGGASGVFVDRQPLPSITDDRAAGWRFDAAAKRLIIRLGARSVREQVVVEITAG